MKEDNITKNDGENLVETQKSQLFALNTIMSFQQLPQAHPTVAVELQCQFQELCSPWWILGSLSYQLLKVPGNEVMIWYFHHSHHWGVYVLPLPDQ